MWIEVRLRGIDSNFLEYIIRDIILLIIFESVEEVEILHDNLYTGPVSFLIEEDADCFQDHEDYRMRVGVSFYLSYVIFIDFLEGLLCLEQHGQGLPELGLSFVFYYFYLYCLFISFLRLSQYLLLNNIGLLFLLRQSLQKLLSLDALLLELGLQFSHLYLQLCHNIIGRVELLQSLSQYLSRGIDLTVLEIENRVEQGELVKISLWG